MLLKQTIRLVFKPAPLTQADKTKSHPSPPLMDRVPMCQRLLSPNRTVSYI